MMSIVVLLCVFGAFFAFTIIWQRVVSRIGQLNFKYKVSNSGSIRLSAADNYGLVKIECSLFLLLLIADGRNDLGRWTLKETKRDLEQAIIMVQGV